MLSRVRLCATPWTVAHQAPLSMGFSRQKYWSGLLFPPPGDLPDPEIEPVSPVSPALQVDSLPTETLGKPVSKSLEHQFLLSHRTYCFIICNWGSKAECGQAESCLWRGGGEDKDTYLEAIGALGLGPPPADPSGKEEAIGPEFIMRAGLTPFALYAQSFYYSLSSLGRLEHT